MSGGTRKRHRAEETQMPENRLLEIVIDILQRRDTYEIFAQPVNADEVEGYYEIVKEPMDFATMRAKLHDDMYRSLDQFKHDVDLITGNAMEFNAPSTIFFKQARGIQELAKRIFHTLVTDPENLESKFMGTRRRSTRIQLVNKSPTPPSRKPPPPVTPTQIPTKVRRNDCKFTRGEELLERDRRCTYTPSSVCGNERGCNQLIPNGERHDDGCSYRKSLWLFVRDLGPTAKMVAARKLGSSSTRQEVLDDPTGVNQNGLGGEVDGQKGMADNATPHVIPVVLALEHSQPNIANPNEYCKWKSRNKKLSNIPVADAERTPLQKLEALMEEQGKKPSTGTGAFTFDLGFLKAQLHKMNTPTKSNPLLPGYSLKE